MSFSPGELTAREVAQLREMLRAKEAFTRLSVSPPLNLTRAGGIPNIGIDLSQNPGEVLIAEVDSSTGTPPVHTVTVQTRNTSNALIDSTPTQTITQVLNFRAISTAIPNGSIVEIFPIPGSVGWWWADYTALSGSTITVEEADGSPSYASIGTLRLDQADGFVVTNPSAGVARIDLADATSTQAGKINTTTQTFGGAKTFYGLVETGVGSGSASYPGVGSRTVYFSSWCTAGSNKSSVYQSYSDTGITVASIFNEWYDYYVGAYGTAPSNTSGPTFQVGASSATFVSSVNCGGYDLSGGTAGCTVEIGSNSNTSGRWLITDDLSATTAALFGYVGTVSSKLYAAFDSADGATSGCRVLARNGFSVGTLAGTQTDGVSGSFTTTDGKTVTVTSGIITAIV